LCEILDYAVVLWNVTLYRRFGQVSLVKEVRCATLKMKTLRSFEKSETPYKSTRRHFPSDRNYQKDCLLKWEIQNDWRTGRAWRRASASVL